MKNKLIISLIALTMILVLTVSATACFFIHPNFTQNSTSNSTIGNIQNPDVEERDPIDYTTTLLYVDALFKAYSIFDVDYEATMLAAIRAYVDATGDKYAMYYTDEEYAALNQENNGDLYGIGVQVIFNYEEHCMEIVLVMPDSPALEHLQIGDKVTHIFVDGERVALADIFLENEEKISNIYPSFTDEENNIAAGNETLNYAVANLKGPEGTFAHFVINREGVEMEMNIKRAKVKTVSVTCKTSIRDNTVGIVSISQFDLTTPTQFKNAMNILIESGCDKFVFDLRNNPGGDLASLEAVLSTLLNKGDKIIITKDKNGTVEESKVDIVNEHTGSYASCNVTAGEIGMYGKYEMVVLVDENSASAAELFTAALRDHGKATIVGTKTYGKGSVQSILPLDYFDGAFGGLRMTTMLYFPPSGEGYDGVGITPECVVELEGIAAETHFYKLTEEIDNQLQKAVSLLID